MINMKSDVDKSISIKIECDDISKNHEYIIKSLSNIMVLLLETKDPVIMSDIIKVLKPALNDMIKVLTNNIGESDAFD